MITNRYPLLDFIRGLAIALMIFFHAAFDSTAVGLTNFDFINDWFWFWLPRLIVFLFFACVGMALMVAHPQGVICDWKKFFRRLSGIALGAIAVSVATYFVFPQNYVVFGTLHCIFFSCLLAPPFMRFPRVSLALAIAVFITYNFIFYFEFPPSGFIVQGSVDFIALYPWMAVVLFGIFLGHYREGVWFKRPYAFLTEYRLWRPLLWMGKRSLLVYLVHQPLLFALMQGLAFLKGR